MIKLTDLLDKKVLVVEDDAATRELVRLRLEVAGMHVSWAENGQQAMAALRNFQPQLMVLDINMPVVDGFGVMSHLGREGMAALPTLVLTARHQADDVERAIALGARDYLAKPFDSHHLLMRMARLVRAVQQPPPRSNSNVVLL